MTMIRESRVGIQTQVDGQDQHDDGHDDHDDHDYHDDHDEYVDDDGHHSQEKRWKRCKLKWERQQ